MVEDLKNMEMSFNRRKIFVGLVLLLSLTAGLVLLQVPEEDSNDSNSTDAKFNRADVMFMNMMIIHHDQAVEMAELAPNRTENKNILALSRNISEAQKAENKQMAEWLRTMGYQRPRDGHRMAGMASEVQMQQLENSKGREFDQLFSELMIKHHRGGIEMARNFRRDGKHSGLRSMQKNMIETQQNEIRMMQSWQESWG